jgi:hypothetical protein
MTSAARQHHSNSGHAAISTCWKCVTYLARSHRSAVPCYCSEVALYVVCCQVPEVLLCKVCMEFKVDTRLNCGHMLCSARCAPLITACPFCRVPVTAREHTFL